MVALEGNDPIPPPENFVA